ncbi:MAG: hypothetical protein JW924_11980 [Fusobacteriaceae bacterium]|nr:hypothetical protein [Fusobacteriaceae bacterium]
MLGRRVLVEIDYEGKNVSKSVNSEHSSFEYTDNINAADEIAFTIHDFDITKPWVNNKHPLKGDKVLVKLLDIEGTKETSFDCGEFFIDDISPNFCPDTITFKAISIELGNKIKLEETTKTWEKTSLKKLATAIASKNKMKIEFKGKDISFSRVEQKEESDGALIQRLAISHGFCVKVIKSTLVIMELSALEKMKTNIVIEKGFIKSGGIKTTDVDTYDSCKIEYYDSKLGEKLKVEVFAKRFNYKASTGKILKFNKNFGVAGSKEEKLTQLKKIAEGKLREKNKKDLTFSFTLFGDFKYVAGATVTLKGFGIYDSGSYILTSVKHKRDSSGYEVSVEGRICLDVN